MRKQAFKQAYEDNGLEVAREALGKSIARWTEARRLLLTENQDATTAAFQVGYESPSQFSREYGRLFGAPPLRDITSLRLMAAPERE